jgi:hypothetical protein
MSASWRLRDFLIVAGPLAVVLSIAVISALGALARRAVCR